MKNRVLSTLGVSVVAGVMLSAHGPAADDMAVASQAAAAVERSAEYTVFDHVVATVRDGVATLTGQVTQAATISALERNVGRVPGIAAVQTDIQVLPPSVFDDQVRRDVYRAIYDHQHFREYRLLEKPTIHIVVSGGKVTLAGVVRDDVDRTLAHSLALQANVRSVTNALTTVRSAQLRR